MPPILAWELVVRVLTYAAIVVVLFLTLRSPGSEPNETSTAGAASSGAGGWLGAVGGVVVAIVLLCCPLARCLECGLSRGPSARKFWSLDANAGGPTTKVPLVYHPQYNITALGLEKLHPFDSTKYQSVFSALRETHSVIADDNDAIVPRPATYPDLRVAHSALYLAKLHSALYLTSVLEVPVIPILPTFLTRYMVLMPMLYQTGGTIAAARVAMDHGWCVNLGGGFHHASGDRGGGFCVYADITLAVHHLRADPAYADRAKRVMIVDLDAHQGNGHERDFIDDPNVFILDCYNPRIYPGDRFAMAGIDTTVHCPWSQSIDHRYLPLVKDGLESSLDAFPPDLLIYNAGTDCMAGDPLGGMQLSAEGIVRRDEIVFDACLGRDIPIVMVLSGGYQTTNAACIAASLANLHAKHGILNRMGEGTGRGSQRQAPARPAAASPGGSGSTSSSAGMRRRTRVERSSSS